MVNTGGEAEWSGQTIDGQRSPPVGPHVAPIGWLDGSGAASKTKVPNTRKTKKPVCRSPLRHGFQHALKPGKRRLITGYARQASARPQQASSDA